MTVPSATWKIEVRVNSDGRLEALAFFMPQTVGDHDPPEKYLTSVRAIEQATHLDFFAELTKGDQDAIETGTATALWR